MAYRFDFQVKGIPEAKKFFKELPALADELAKKTLFELGQDIFAVSQLTVPVDTGKLRASAQGPYQYGIKEEGNHHFSTMISYGNPDVPYALAVHENPRAGHTEGVNPDGSKRKHWAMRGEWKYLENPIKEVGPTYPERLRANMDELLKKR